MYLKELFTTLPKIQAVRWTQYTPYFNDGDECVFGLASLFIKYEGMNPEDAEDGDGFVYCYDYGDDAKVSKQFAKWFNTLWDDDIFLSAFGNHMQITVTPEGIETSEYEHD